MDNVPAKTVTVLKDGTVIEYIYCKKEDGFWVTMSDPVENEPIKYFKPRDNTENNGEPND